MINTLATYNLLLVFTAILSTFSGFPMYSCNDHVKIEYKIYCSNNLSNALELICGGRFYSFSKKYPEAIGGSSSPRFYQQSMLLRKLIPQDHHKPQSSGSTGSTHECCKRPCGYAELRLYCAGN